MKVHASLLFDTSRWWKVYLFYIQINNERKVGLNEICCKQQLNELFHSIINFVIIMNQKNFTKSTLIYQVANLIFLSIKMFFYTPNNANITYIFIAFIRCDSSCDR